MIGQANGGLGSTIDKGVDHQGAGGVVSEEVNFQIDGGVIEIELSYLVVATTFKTLADDWGASAYDWLDLQRAQALA